MQPDQPAAPHRALSRLVDDGLCRSVLHLATTASTNAVAMAEASAGDASPLPRLIVADQQTGGRGRLGRSWHSDAGTLTMSLVYRLVDLRLSDDCVPAIALTAGMAVADAIELLVPPIQARLKWPNDVYVDGGKVAGILVEASSAPFQTSVTRALAEGSDAAAAGEGRRVIIGIGVNVATDLGRADAEVAARARSLDALSGRPLQRYELVPLIVAQMQQRLDQLADDQAELFRQYRQRCWLTGRTVRVHQHQRTLAGTVLGIQADGALLLRTATGDIPIRSGELLL